MVERSLSMREVGGSIPPFSTDSRFCSHHGVLLIIHCIYDATQIGCHPSLAEAPSIAQCTSMCALNPTKLDKVCISLGRRICLISFVVEGHSGKESDKQ